MSWERAGAWGASWSEGSELGGWEQTGSKLAPTLPIAPCPPEAPGTQGCSGEQAGSKGSQLGAS